MSAGPIKAWRNSWIPARVSSTDVERACYMKHSQPRAYCGRKPKVAYDDWAKVTCSDCLAAGRADSDGRAS